MAITVKENHSKSKECLSCMLRDKTYLIRISTLSNPGGLEVELCDNCLQDLSNKIQEVLTHDNG